MATVVAIYSGGHIGFTISGGQTGFTIRKILAAFVLQVTQILPTKFQVYWHFGSGEEVKK